jgi:hypothetical protein
MNETRSINRAHGDPQSTAMEDRISPYSGALENDSPRPQGVSPRMSRYNVKAPIRGFFLSRSGRSRLVAMPVSAMLTHLPDTVEPSRGTTSVRWEGREYSILEADLYQKCARVRFQ